MAELFIRESYFKNLVSKVKHKYEDVSTIYGDLSRFVEEVLRQTSKEKFNEIYHTHFKGSPNYNAIQGALEKHIKTRGKNGDA